jgi:tRNA(adenine34) deaminase
LVFDPAKRLNAELTAFYEEALDLAEQAARAGEVPVGALVLGRATSGGYEILARSHNQIISWRDPTAHAELIAVREAAAMARSERLPGAVLISTLEPCLMCAGSIYLARLAAVHFMTNIISGPGISSMLEAFPPPAFNHYPALTFVEEYQDRAAKLLRSFFQARRV